MLPELDAHAAGAGGAGDVLAADGDAAVNDGPQSCLQHIRTRMLCLQV